jgi:uncharacterized membrane protein
LPKIGPNRRQKPNSDAAASTANNNLSQVEKCWGSAKFGKNDVIIEPKQKPSGVAQPVA